MLALPDPASNVTSDVVFTSKKSGVSVDDRAAKHYHRTVGCMFCGVATQCSFCDCTEVTIGAMSGA